jgi:hypothetical protein
MRSRDFHLTFIRAKPDSEVRKAFTFGVLKLTLRARTYDWQFIPVAGSSFTDSSSGSCN